MARLAPFFALAISLAVLPSAAEAAKPECVTTLTADITDARGKVITLLQNPKGKSVDYANQMRDAMYAYLGTSPSQGGLEEGIADRGKARWLDNACLKKNKSYRGWMEKTLSGAIGPVLDDGFKTFRLNCTKAAEADSSASTGFWDDCGVRPTSAATGNAVGGAALSECEARVAKKVDFARGQLELGGSSERMEGIVSRLHKDLGPSSKEAKECGASAAAALASFDAEAGEQVDAKNADGHARCVADLRKEISIARDAAREAAENPPKIRSRGSSKMRDLETTVRYGLVSLRESLDNPQSRLHASYKQCGSDVDGELALLEQEVDAFVVQAAASQAGEAVSLCRRVAEFHFRVLRGVANNDLSDFPSQLMTRWVHSPEDIQQLGTVCSNAIRATSPDPKADFGQMNSGQRSTTGVPSHLPNSKVLEIATQMQTDAEGWIADAQAKRARVYEKVRADWIAANVKGADMLTVFRKRAEPGRINTGGGKIYWIYGFVNEYLSHDTCDAYVFSSSGKLLEEHSRYACAKN